MSKQVKTSDVEQDAKRFSRRQFLVSSGAVLSAAVIVACTGRASASRTRCRTCGWRGSRRTRCCTHASHWRLW